MNMRILITGHLPENVISPLKEKYQVEMNQEDRPMDRQVIISGVKDKHGLLPMFNDFINEEVLNCAPHLKMIANFGVGYNNIDVRSATARGIMVSNTPGVLTCLLYTSPSPRD